MRQTTIFDDTVASKIERILARCDKVKRGSSLFDAAGQAAARAIAAADGGEGGGSISKKATFGNHSGIERYFLEK